MRTAKILHHFLPHLLVKKKKKMIIQHYYHMISFLSIDLSKYLISFEKILIYLLILIKSEHNYLFQLWNMFLIYHRWLHLMCIIQVILNELWVEFMPLDFGKSHFILRVLKINLKYLFHLWFKIWKKVIIKIIFYSSQ